ncbi:hypothetical protein A359_02540 [secondary endosymbiont of Ctenarytaina eucalypti]|uniref:Uncharacterized protein n=1 Tax=secondary endosymbiont of Ctenarytaina eucalypti TaxID=1199245 RepID=J3TX39_9ENTR|nr:hypothetical protein A359_02540 [secondary endosymbiont of Ctenarytaina eucalypti]
MAAFAACLHLCSLIALFDGIMPSTKQYDEKHTASYSGRT